MNEDGAFEGRVVLGVLWLLTLALLVAANGWLLTGCLAPYLVTDEPDYLILLRPYSDLAAWFLGSLVLLGLAHLLRTWRAVRAGVRSRAFDWRSLGYLSPLLLLGVPAASVIALATTPLRPWVAPWLYASFDLRSWLILSIAVLIAIGCARASWRERLRRLVDHADTAAGRRLRLWFEVSLAAVLVASSLLSSPPARFQSAIVGDEPKYLRYLENWYQGRGMDVGGLAAISELPDDFAPDIAGNFRQLGPALTDAFADVVADLRRLLGLPGSPPPGPARSQSGWFVEGKRGGVYQVHNPGLSFVLFPGYVVDRAVGDQTAAWHPQFPTDLYGTNLIVLMIYVLWGIAVFRLLSHYTGRAIVSWLLACLVSLSLPVTAFAYQYYPEVAAGLLVALLARYAILSSDARGWPAAGYGLLAGYLPWLHLRFMPLAIGAAVAVAVTRRRDRRALGWFSAGLAPPLLALAVYYYHVTGSSMPWALYALTNDAPLFSATRAWHDLPAFWFDRTWGLVAHSPVYLLALPGLWLSWRRHKGVAVAMSVAILAVAIPAAGHGYSGAATTPLRLLAAVVPLLALPLADTAITWGRSACLRASLVVLGLISVQNGWTYNTNLNKSQPWLQDSSTSGWLFPLLLPDFEVADRLADPLTVVWLVVSAGLLACPVLIAKWGAKGCVSNRPWPPTAVALTAVLLLASIGSVAGACSERQFRPDLMLRPGDARDRLIHFDLTRSPDLRWSSRRGWVNLESYFPNPEGTTTALTVRPQATHGQAPVEIVVEARRPGDRPGWGTAEVDFGDGSPPVRLAIEGAAAARHAYARPGAYVLKADVKLWGMPARSLIERVLVH